MGRALATLPAEAIAASVSWETQALHSLVANVRQTCQKSASFFVRFLFGVIIGLPCALDVFAFSVSSNDLNMCVFFGFCFIPRTQKPDMTTVDLVTLTLKNIAGPPMNLRTIQILIGA